MRRAHLTMIEYCCVIAAILLAIQLHNGAVAQEPLHVTALSFAMLSLLFAAHHCRMTWHARTSLAERSRDAAVAEQDGLHAIEVRDGTASRLHLDHAGSLAPRESRARAASDREQAGETQRHDAAA